MVTAYLGTKFDGHDTAAFLLLPHSREVYGLSTDRLTRVKHDDLFPVGAIQRLAEEARESLKSVDRICCANSFSSHRSRVFPLDQYNRELERRRSIQLLKLVSDTDEFRHQIRPRLSNEFSQYGTLHEIILHHVRKIFPGKVVTVNHFDHEYCHARSSYDFCPFDDALVLTMDGSGDDGVFSRAYHGNNGQLHPLCLSNSAGRIQDARPGCSFSAHCSLGGIYAYFTYLMGFIPNSEEGKLEALAAQGQPIPHLCATLISACRIDKCSASFEIDLKQVDAALRMCATHDMKSDVVRADMAATAQSFLEVAALSYIRHLLHSTGLQRVCLSGGVFANVLLNMKISEIVKNQIYIAPAFGDDGSAQGAASACLVADTAGSELPLWLRTHTMPYFGTSYSRSQVSDALTRWKSRVVIQELSGDIKEEIATRVHAGQIGALFHGRMEFGPRALGNRSILANPCEPRFKDRINSQIKRRPPFQPVCPAVLVEEMARLFPSAYANPHMTCAFSMRPEYRAALPAAIHTDGTSRVQFVSAESNPTLYAILQHLKTLNGYGVILNTSFNIHGKAIVENPYDALEDFLESGMDFMAIEGVLVCRKHV
jgi:carbamoyltransferase